MTNTNGQMVPRNAAMKEVRGLLEHMRPQFELALPKLLNSDRFIRIALTEIQRTPKLLKCTQVSLLGALMECAQLGLEPGVLGQAYLIPYKQTATLIVGYKGLINLARRSGQVSSISAHVAHEKDEFDFGFGDSPFIKHKPTQEADPGKIIAVYGVAILTDGSKHLEVMWIRQVEAIRKRSRAGNDGPWVTDYEEMARKTVIRRICKYLPLSVELQRAVVLDEQADAGLPQQIDYDIIPAAAIEAEAKPDERPALEKAAEQLEAKTIDVEPAKASAEETPQAPVAASAPTDPALDYAF